MTAPENHPSETQGQSLAETLAAITECPRTVIGIPVLAGLVALVVVLFLPHWYTSTVRLMPPQQSQSHAAAILGQLGALAGGSAQSLGIKNPSDIYVAMLKSRTVADTLIRRFDLLEVYGEDSLHFARIEFAKHSSISTGKEGVITIEVEDKVPDRAARIANAYVELLRELTMKLAVSEASQRRVFFESQLSRAKEDLVKAETALKVFTQSAGLINPQDQLRLSVAAAAALRAQITVKEIQLSAMRSFATESNPEVERGMRELQGLRSELGKLERSGTADQGDVLVPFGKAPEIGLEYIRKYRDVKYFETLYEALAKQYEIARIDEATDATLIQVLDSALPAERKSRPKRLLILLITILAASVASVSLALVRAAALRSAQSVAVASQLQRLRILPLLKALK